ncbi:MAG TPA: sulfurtransferase [Arenimonas sp.]|nr:sulfurtransferase [Arenimonas sp.]
MNWTTLVDADALHAALGSPTLRLVDCRHQLADPEAGLRAGREAHLPGAGHAHLDRELSDLSKPKSQGRHPLPDAAAFCATLARLGITPESQVVAYDAGDGAMAAARFWWLLRLLGHRCVAVLDGGIAAWQAAGYPVRSDAPSIAPGSYHGEFSTAAQVDLAAVQTRLGQAPGWLLDARPPERFRGEVEPLDPVAGHIPGARNRPVAANLRDGRFKPADELRAELQAQIGGYRPEDVVLSCGSGVTACHNLLAMEHAGLPGARVFPASWSGWVSDASRPIATGA